MPLGPYFIAIMHFNMGSGVIEVFHCILLLHIDAKVEAKSFYFRSVANKPVAAVKIMSKYSHISCVSIYLSYYLFCIVT